MRKLGSIQKNGKGYTARCKNKYAGFFPTIEAAEQGIIDYALKHNIDIPLPKQPEQPAKLLPRRVKEYCHQCQQVRTYLYIETNYHCCFCKAIL